MPTTSRDVNTVTGGLLLFLALLLILGLWVSEGRSDHPAPEPTPTATTLPCDPLCSQGPYRTGSSR